MIAIVEGGSIVETGIPTRSSFPTHTVYMHLLFKANLF